MKFPTLEILSDMAARLRQNFNLYTEACLVTQSNVDVTKKNL